MLDQGEIRGIQVKMKLVGSMVETMNLAEFLETIDDAFTLGPLLHPGTCDGKWMDTADKWKELAEALKVFKDTYQKIWIHAGTKGDEENGKN